MNVPRVSVVVPCYNSGWSVERTIASILAQRFEDFELLVVNDGSTDDLHSKLAPLLESDQRLRVIDQANGGVARARNRGIEEARGEYVGPIDADDLWHPDFLKEAVAALDADADAPLAYSYSFRIDMADRLLPIVRFGAPPRHDFRGLLSLNSVGSGSAALFRRSAVIAAGGYDETMRIRAAQGAEDWKLILQLAATGKPALVERFLVGYRLVGESLSQANPRRQLDAILAVIDDLRHEFPTVELRWFADGRTMMTAWLLPTFLRRGLFAEATREMVNAYIRNPLWFRNAMVRHIHLYRLKLTAKHFTDKVRGRTEHYPFLRTVEMDGERPFAYLAAYEDAR